MSYKVKLKTGGFELEIEGDREFVESRISDLSWLDSIFDKLGASEAFKKEESLVEGKPAFTEFANRVDPKRNWEKFLTIAYYLYRWENRDVTYEDIKNFYRKIRWPIPGNIRDVMSNLIKEGYMEEADRLNDRKAFRILQKGIRYIEEAAARGEES